MSDRLDLLSELTVSSFDRPKPDGEAIGHVKVDLEGDSAVEATFYRGSGADEAIAVVPGRAAALAVDAAKVARAPEGPEGAGKGEGGRGGREGEAVRTVGDD